MNSRLKKQTEALAALSATDRARLERLAALAEISPEDMWPEVWHYGFDDVEESVQADLDAEEYFKTNQGIDNAEVMAKALAVIQTQPGIGTLAKRGVRRFSIPKTGHVVDYRITKTEIRIIRWARQRRKS